MFIIMSLEGKASLSLSWPIEKVRIGASDCDKLVLVMIMGPEPRGNEIGNLMVGSTLIITAVIMGLSIVPPSPLMRLIIVGSESPPGRKDAR